MSERVRVKLTYITESNTSCSARTSSASKQFEVCVWVCDATARNSFFSLCRLDQVLHQASPLFEVCFGHLLDATVFARVSSDFTVRLLALVRIPKCNLAGFTPFGEKNLLCNVSAVLTVVSVALESDPTNLNCLHLHLLCIAFHCFPLQPDTSVFCEVLIRLVAVVVEHSLYFWSVVWFHVWTKAIPIFGCVNKLLEVYVTIQIHTRIFSERFSRWH